MINLNPYKLLFLLAVTLNTSQLHALKSEHLIDINDLPPQLCKVEFGLSLCSGIMVGKKEVLTASHCNNLNEKRGQVTCLNGQKFKFKNDQVHFFDANKVPSGLVTADTREALKHDLLLIRLNEEFNLEPMSFLKASNDPNSVIAALRTKGACQLYGVGLNPFGTLGLAHGIIAPVYQGLSLTNPLELIGQDGVSPHDSGGGYVCELEDESGKKQKTLVGVIVGGKDNGAEVSSIMSLLSDERNSSWLKEALTYQEL